MLSVFLNRYSTRIGQCCAGGCSAVVPVCYRVRRLYALDAGDVEMEGLILIVTGSVDERKGRVAVSGIISVVLETVSLGVELDRVGQLVGINGFAINHSCCAGCRLPGDSAVTTNCAVGTAAVLQRHHAAHRVSHREARAQAGLYVINNSVECGVEGISVVGVKCSITRAGDIILQEIENILSCAVANCIQIVGIGCFLQAGRSIRSSLVATDTQTAACSICTVSQGNSEFVIIIYATNI